MTTEPHTYTGQLADGTCVAVRVAEGRIADVASAPLDASLPQLLPVLVDLQHNGALGYEFSHTGMDEGEGLSKVASFVRQHGVGRCLPTLITHPREALEGSVQRLDEILRADADLARLYCGVFHEGVYISPKEGWRGVHDPSWIRPPDWDEFATLDRMCGNRIRIVNVAPEEPGGLDFVKRAVEAGKLVALGHACPDAATVHKAADNGASLVTHFGNGAAALVSRFDNPFWAMLNEPRLRLGLIGDGFHLPPDLAGAALRCKGPDGCVLVSDAAHISGLPPGRYDDAYADPCVIEPNGHLHVADAPFLAGAWFQLDRSVEWLVETQGLSLRQAWRLCSEVPATILGEELPGIEVGAEASFVLAHWDNGLVIDQSVHGGQAYIDAPIRPTDCNTTG